MSHFAVVIGLSIFSPQDWCESQGTLLAWQELITALIKVTFQTEAKRQTSLSCEAPGKLGLARILSRIWKILSDLKRVRWDFQVGGQVSGTFP